ncbi:MAG: DNA photolyase [Leptospiraceae bacterium]|nr:DNA photolyase [Leptospiraceae bacterium]
MKYSHIYIESQIREHFRTKEILIKFPDAKIIQIENYKNIFNRPNQNFQAQKSGARLILAKKIDQFYYPGSGLTDQFKIKNFYYNSLILNCVYNCDYCYLQGMYNSGHTVVFVNLEDYFTQTKELLNELKTVYLCISYDTDILAFENLVPYTKEWIGFAKVNPDLLLEVRTKSNLFSRIQNLDPIPNVILAWTLSPEVIIKSYEKKTPTLNRRIENVVRAINAGWKVRLCFDPILYIPNWEKIYSEFIEKVFQNKELSEIFDLSIGAFRINSDYLKKIKKMRTDSDILYFPFERKGTARYYPEAIENKMLSLLEAKITKYIDRAKIYK